MREQNIEVIRKAVIAAQPDIMELKFGCDVYIETLEGYGGGDTINQHRRITAKQCHEEQLPMYLVGAYFGERGYIQADFGAIAGMRGSILPNVYRIVEVVGRPIRLADVLYSLTKLPDLEPFDLPGFWIEVIGRYNLRKDTLTDQSDECLAFLANLLK